ncbi:MAG: hypothetical protein QOJ40_2828 [Verrucomicrobiota bacterium]
MNDRIHSPPGSGPVETTGVRNPRQSTRIGFAAGAILGLLIGAVIAFKLLSPRAGAPLAGPAATAPAAPAVSEQRTEKIVPPAQVPVARTEPVAIQPGPRSAEDLVAELAALNGTNGPITSEQAEKFKRAHAALIAQGRTSVPAIQELLDKNVDNVFADIAGGDQLGYSSLRASLFDALREIGGPEAEAATLHVLQTTAFPSELLELSKNLEEAAPGQYRDEIVKAARESLEMASANQLGNNVEIGPVFRLLQNYGEAGTGSEAAKNEKVDAAIAMANLPDGQGLPSLIEMAQNSSGGAQTIATEMIAQLAGQNPQAVDTLMQMAQNGQIANNVWVKLAPILGGDQYQSGNSTAGSAGGQNYSIVNGATTPDQVNQRIGLIDKFLGAVPQDSAAAAALQHERDALSGKLPK